MTATDYLLGLARRSADLYSTLPGIKVLMVTGSVALGISDYHSDIDMTAYYDEALPSEDDLTAIRLKNQGSERLWVIGDRDHGAFAESYVIHGIHLQIGHTLTSVWEAEIASVMAAEDVKSSAQKALSGTLDCIPLFGEEIMRQWKDTIRQYPDALARAMVEQHLQFFPFWSLYNHIAVRDGTLWTYQILVEGAQNLFGILAGLNHLYYSAFQFKRMRAFVAKMQYAPANLADRIESLFNGDLLAASLTLEELVRETVELVEQHMPDIDTTAAKRRIGWRHEAWKPQA